MITEFREERSVFHSPTGGGSYSDSDLGSNEPVRSVRKSTLEATTRNGRQARKTAAISLEVNYLLGLLSRAGERTNQNEVASEEEARHACDGQATAREIRNPKWKRGLDLTCTLLTLPFWLTAMIFIALWVKLSSRGPVFYRQSRIGLGGRPFTILKFRSMRLNADTTKHTDHFAKLIETNTSMTKLDSLGDSRMIPGGCWLRAAGLDELPQLLNVLRGEMSLVGPRPCLPQEFERYEDWHKGRVYVPPGLTGYWQVNGKNKTSFKQMVELDLLYAERMSLGLDLAVMLATIPALILQFVEARSRCIRDDLRNSKSVHPPLSTPFLNGASEPLNTSSKAA